MNSLAVKGVAGIVASVAVAGVAGVTIKLSSNKKESQSIKTLLGKNKPEKRLLIKGYQDKRDGSPAEWQNVWRQYRTDYQNEKNNPFNLTLVKSNNIQDEPAPENFISACASLFEEKVDGVNSYRYQLADKYCTRLTSVTDLVLEKNKKVLAKGNNGQSPEWRGLWKKYRDDNRSKGAGEDIWKLSGSPWTSVNGDQVDAPDDFRSKCESESQVKTGYKNNTSFLNVLEYCSVPK